MTIQNLIDRIRGSQPAAETEKAAEGPAPPRRTFVVVGLGNPGQEHAKNRHNIGFMLVDRLAEMLDIRFARMQSRALVADARLAGQRVILVKPQTYMNESGQSVAALQKFYKIPLEDMLVAFDEMDLPLGVIRIRPRGGSSGHNGMKSIIRRLSGSQGFPRIRLGIGRPPGQMPAPAYLLQDFAKEDRDILPGFLDEAAQAALMVVTDGLEAAMNRYNGEFSGHA
jgi:PTH1 family peptidyl-tRNA hydrolase